MGFSVFRACMTVLIVLLLLLLFLVPSQYLVRVSDAAQDELTRAKAALLASDLPEAQAACDALSNLYDDNALALERFLNHASVDSFGAALHAADTALSVGDASAAIEALAEAETILERIRAIELFSPNSLL